jgi:hypothetical protein
MYLSITSHALHLLAHVETVSTGAYTTGNTSAGDHFIEIERSPIKGYS